MLPVQITIRNIPNSQAIENRIRQKAEKLTQFCQRINSCRVVVDFSKKHQHQGKLYRVHIDLTVPGKELAVNRKWNEDLYVAIRDAFDALERQLENYIQRRRGELKRQANGRGKEDWIVKGIRGQAYTF